MSSRLRSILLLLAVAGSALPSDAQFPNYFTMRSAFESGNALVSKADFEEYNSAVRSFPVGVYHTPWVHQGVSYSGGSDYLVAILGGDETPDQAQSNMLINNVGTPVVCDVVNPSTALIDMFAVDLGATVFENNQTIVPGPFTVSILTNIRSYTKDLTDVPRALDGTQFFGCRVVGADEHIVRVSFDRGAGGAANYYPAIDNVTLMQHREGGTVPEPGVLVLVAVGVAGFGAWRLRKSG